MKILDAGHHPLSNADVLDWVQRKRAQHARDDAEDRTAGLKPTERPKNFLRVLTRTERELSSDKYPYLKNPTAYQGEARSARFEKFALAAEDALQTQLEAEWKGRLETMTSQQVQRQFAAQQEKKSLTEPELLMLYNHAPVCVETLQPMIENVEERFSAVEQHLLLEVVVKMLRPDQDIALPEPPAS